MAWPLRNKSQLNFDHKQLRGLGCSELSSGSSDPPFPLWATVTTEQLPPAALAPSCLYALLKLRGSILDSGQAPLHNTSPNRWDTWSAQQPAPHTRSLSVGTRQDTTAQRQEWEPRESCWRLNTLRLHLARKKTWISGLQQVSSSSEGHLGSLGRRDQALGRHYQACSIIQNGSNTGYETTWGGGEPVLHPQDLIILKK